VSETMAEHRLSVSTHHGELGSAGGRRLASCDVEDRRENNLSVQAKEVRVKHGALVRDAETLGVPVLAKCGERPPAFEVAD